MIEDSVNRTFGAAIGWDWADKKHQLCLKVFNDEQTESFELPNKVEEIQSWATEIGKRFENQKIAIAIEQSRGPVIYLLMQFEFFVLYPINTTTISNYRKALRSSGAKDDPSDAELLVDFLLTHHRRLRPWAAEDDLTMKLRTLVEYRRKFVDSASELSRRMIATLKTYYPQSLQWFSDLKTPIACDFLMNWTSPEQVRRATAVKLRKFFYTHNCRSTEAIDRRIAEIHAVQPLTRNEAIVSASVLIIQCFVQQMRTTLESIASLDQAISECFNTHPDLFLYKSLPGAGPALEPRLAVAMGTDRSRYDNAQQLQQFSGTAPVTAESGNQKWVHMRWACPKFMRQTFVEFAACSIPLSSWASECYDRLREQKKGHHAALRVVAFKWQRILFRCWKDGVAYDEQLYLSRLRCRRSATSQTVQSTSPKTGMVQAKEIIEDIQTSFLATSHNTTLVEKVSGRQKKTTRNT